MKSIPGADRIGDSGDPVEVANTVAKFIEACDGSPRGGLVFREELDFIRDDGGRVQEVRTFVKDGEVAWSGYRDTRHTGTLPCMDWLRMVAAQIASRFFTIDAGQTRDGSWRVIEIGDGQVSELPLPADPAAFVQAIDRWS